MIDFRVRDLDAMISQLRAAGLAVEVDSEEYPNGRFARSQIPTEPDSALAAKLTGHAQADGEPKAGFLDEASPIFHRAGCDRSRHRVERRSRGRSSSTCGRSQPGVDRPPRRSRDARHVARGDYSRANAAMSRAVSRLMSGQTKVRTSVPCTVPIICRHRAGTPARSSRR